MTKKTRNEALVFFTVFNPKNDYDLNVINTLGVAKQLDRLGISYVRYLTRALQGNTVALVINANDFKKIEHILELHKQNDVLFIAPDRTASIITMDNNKNKEIGTLTRVEYDEAQAAKDTFFINTYNKNFYVIK